LRRCLSVGDCWRRIRACACLCLCPCLRLRLLLVLEREPVRVCSHGRLFR
jgi:hypothetical protein